MNRQLKSSPNEYEKERLTLHGGSSSGLQRRGEVIVIGVGHDGFFGLVNRETKGDHAVDTGSEAEGRKETGSANDSFSRTKGKQTQGGGTHSTGASRLKPEVRREVS